MDLSGLKLTTDRGEGISVYACIMENLGGSSRYVNVDISMTHINWAYPEGNWMR